MWPFSQPDKTFLPDINKVPTDPAFAAIIYEYQTRRTNERLAGCLSGGGSFGRHEAGWLAYANQIGLLSVVDMLAGTSVGALNATVLGLDMTAESLVKLWRGIKQSSDVYGGNLISSGIFGGLWRAGLLDPRPLYAIIQAALGGKELLVPVFTIATEFQTKRMAVFGPNEYPVDRALASSAVPGAFPAWKVRDRYYMDGGLIQNVPIEYLLDNCGVTKMFVLYCTPDAPDTLPEPLAQAPAAKDTGIAIVNAALSAQDEYTYAIVANVQKTRAAAGQDPVEVAQFWPQKATGNNFLDFSNVDALQQGYDDAVKYLNPAKVTELLKP